MKKFLLATFVATMVFSTNVFAATTTEKVVPVPISAPITTVNQQTFKTTETATVKVAPDMATVNVTINNRAKTASSAKALNDKAIKEVTANLVKSGLVTEKQISTASFYLYPVYNYDYNTNTQTEDGYSADTTLQIVVKDLTKLNQVFDKVLETSSTAISYTSFETSKYEDYYNEALVTAIKKAQKRADFIASEVYNGSKATMSEIVSNGSNGYYYEANTAGANMKMSDSVNYVPNTINVSASAEMTFSIK